MTNQCKDIELLAPLICVGCICFFVLSFSFHLVNILLAHRKWFQLIHVQNKYCYGWVFDQLVRNKVHTVVIYVQYLHNLYGLKSILSRNWYTSYSVFWFLWSFSVENILIWDSFKRALLYLTEILEISFQILWGRVAPEMKYWLYDKIEVRYNNAFPSLPPNFVVTSIISIVNAVLRLPCDEGGTSGQVWVSLKFTWTHKECIGMLVNQKYVTFYRM